MGRGERGGRRDNIGIGRKKVIMRLYEIMYVKLLKAVKHYSHSVLNTCSVQFSHSVMSDSLRPHESQHARPPCPSPTPGVH